MCVAVPQACEDRPMTDRQGEPTDSTRHEVTCRRRPRLPAPAEEASAWGAYFFLAAAFFLGALFFLGAAFFLGAVFLAALGLVACCCDGWIGWVSRVAQSFSRAGKNTSQAKQSNARLPSWPWASSPWAWWPSWAWRPSWAWTPVIVVCWCGGSIARQSRIHRSTEPSPNPNPSTIA